MRLVETRSSVPQQDHARSGEMSEGGERLEGTAHHFCPLPEGCLLQLPLIAIVHL